MDILVYAVIAGLIIYRLYTVLGQRDGGERGQRPNPFILKTPQNSGESPTQPMKKDKEDLLALPLAMPKKQEQLYPQGQEQQAVQPFFAEPAAQSLAGGLFAIQKADPSFDERGFLKGARTAFEMIVRAFVGGDRVTLKNLLTPKLYAAFESAISEREIKGERWEMKTLIIKDMDVVGATMDGNIAILTVQCVSEQSKTTFDKNGALLRDPGREVESLTDIWTWRRDTKSANPNWQLVETKSV